MLFESIQAATGNQTLVMTGMSDSLISYDQLGFLGQDSNILGRLKACWEGCNLCDAQARKQDEPSNGLFPGFSLSRRQIFP